MARPTLARNRKTRRAAHAINAIYPGLGEIIVRGALEILWEPAYETGDPYVGDEDDVERTVAWPGPAGVFCQALLTAGGAGRHGFIEPVEGGGYVIHDFWDHAPDYVRKRHAREASRTSRTKTEPVASHRPVADQSLTGHCPPLADCQSQSVRTPSPSPAPSLKEKHLPESEQAEGERSEQSEQSEQSDDPPPKSAAAKPRADEQRFAGFWDAYPRKVARGDAAKAWRSLAPDAALATQILAAVEQHKRLPDWAKDGGQFVPYPATWLRARRWEDVLEAPRVNGNGASGGAPFVPHANPVIEELRRKNAEILAAREADLAAEGDAELSAAGGAQ